MDNRRRHPSISRSRAQPQEFLLKKHRMSMPPPVARSHSYRNSCSNADCLCRPPTLLTNSGAEQSLRQEVHRRGGNSTAVSRAVQTGDPGCSAQHGQHRNRQGSSPGVRGFRMERGQPRAAHISKHAGGYRQQQIRRQFSGPTLRSHKKEGVRLLLLL